MVFYTKFNTKRSESAPDSLHHIKQIGSRLDAIDSQLASMRVALFELSNGEFNPFYDDIQTSHSIDNKIDDYIPPVPQAEEKNNSSFESKKIEENAFSHITAQIKSVHDVPQGKEFFFNDGFIAKNLKELYEHLLISEEAFGHHCTNDRNDFASWTKEILQHHELAQQMNASQNRAEFLDALREHVQ